MRVIYLFFSFCGNFPIPPFICTRVAPAQPGLQLALQIRNHTIPGLPDPHLPLSASQELSHSLIYLQSALQILINPPSSPWGRGCITVCSQPLMPAPSFLALGFFPASCASLVWRSGTLSPWNGSRTVGVCVTMAGDLRGRSLTDGTASQDLPEVSSAACSISSRAPACCSLAFSCSFSCLRSSLIVLFAFPPGQGGCCWPSLG